MTQTLTTEELRQIVETDHVQCGDAAAMARELLANREAQPVAEYGDAYQGAREDLSIWKRRALEAEGKVRHLERVNDHLVKEAQGEHRLGEPIITATPAPAPAAVKLPTEFYSDEGVVVRLEEVMAALALVGVKYERKGNACRAAMLAAAPEGGK